MKILEEFKQLCLSANEACDTLASTRDFESHLLRVLLFIKEHPENIGEFKRYFIEMIGDPELGPWELIAFCMKELQWKEILDEAERQLHAFRDFRVKRIMGHIISAYQPDWNHAGMYKYYSDQHS